MLGRRFLLILATNFVGAVGGLVALFFVNRYAGPDALGMFAYALGITGLASFLASLGLDSAHVKRVSEGVPVGDALATFTRLKVLLVLAFTVLTALAAGLWYRLRGPGQDVAPAVLALALAYQVFLQLRAIPTQTFNALLETGRAQIVILTEHAAKVPLLILAALLYGALLGDVPGDAWFESWGHRLGGSASIEWGAIAISAAFALTMAISLAVGLWLLSHERYPPGTYSPSLARRYARFALPLALFSLLTPLATQLDSVMIGFYGSNADVGYYYNAQRIVTFTYIIPTAVGTLFFPRMSELVARGERASAKVFALQTQRALSLVIWGPTVILLAFPREVIHLLSDRFQPSAPILMVLALNIAVVSYSTVSSSVLMAHGAPRAVASIGAAVLGLNAILNVAFIAPYGLNLGALGASLATLVAQTFGLVLMIWRNARATGETPLGLFVLKHVASAALTFGLVLWLKPLVFVGGITRWYELAAGSMAAGAAYLLALTILGEMGRREWHLFWDALHPARLARYLRLEVKSRRE